MIGAELEELLRRLIREELAKLRGEQPSDAVDPLDKVRARAVEDAAKMRAARRGGRG